MDWHYVASVDEAIFHDPVYSLFSNNSSSIWRELTPCPYHEATRQQCPFGQHCCFVDESCRHTSRQRWPQRKPRSPVEQQVYDDLVSLFPGRTPPRSLGFSVACDRKSPVHACLLERNAVLRLPLGAYLRQYGVRLKQALCRVKHIDGDGSSSECQLAHAPAELFAQFAQRSLVDYYQHHVVEASAEEEGRLVPLPHAFISCTHCACKHITHLSPQVRLYPTGAIALDGRPLTLPVIDVYCARCAGVTTFPVYHLMTD